MNNIRKYLLSFNAIWLLGLISVIAFGCAESKPAPQGVDRNLQRTDPPYINITENIIYPGSEPYEDATYHYFSEDSQALVAHWFEVNLENAQVTKKTGMESQREIWFIRYQDMTIEILPGPLENSSLIQYKRDVE